MVFRWLGPGSPRPGPLPRSRSCSALRPLPACWAGSPGGREAGHIMVYKSTEDVVQRVMPLLELLAERTIDKARLLQYLSARAGIEWGALDLIEEREGDGQHPSERPLTLQVSDRSAGETSEIEYPACLP